MCPCEGRDPVLGSCLRRSTSILTRPDPGAHRALRGGPRRAGRAGRRRSASRCRAGRTAWPCCCSPPRRVPASIEAATVDHALRPESRAEAEMVADLCERIGVPHAILTVDWPTPPRSNLQARAREGRYRLLGEWALRARTRRRRHRASSRRPGGNLADAPRPRRRRRRPRRDPRRRPLVEGVRLVRPLLGWRKAELAALVASAGIKPVDDPANRDPRHDRVRMREWLKRADWADPERLAASAAWLNEADEALDWALAPLAEKRDRARRRDAGRRSVRNAARASAPVASRRLRRTGRFTAPRSRCRPGARRASQGRASPPSPASSSKAARPGACGRLRRGASNADGAVHPLLSIALLLSPERLF